MAANFRAKRNTKLTTEYNRTAHELSTLEVGNFVAIQNQRTKRWDITGLVVEVLPERQYRISIDGSGRITLRNRRFMKKILMALPQIIPSAGNSCPISTPIHPNYPVLNPKGGAKVLYLLYSKVCT